MFFVIAFFILSGHHKLKEKVAGPNIWKNDDEFQVDLRVVQRELSKDFVDLALAQVDYTKSM